MTAQNITKSARQVVVGLLGLTMRGLGFVLPVRAAQEMLDGAPMEPMSYILFCVIWFFGWLGSVVIERIDNHVDTLEPKSRPIVNASDSPRVVN